MQICMYTCMCTYTGTHVRKIKFYKFASFLLCLEAVIYVCGAQRLGCLKALGACTRGKVSMLSFRCFVCRQSKQQLEEEQKKALYGLENAGNHCECVLTHASKHVTAPGCLPHLPSLPGCTVSIFLSSSKQSFQLRKC